MANPKAAERLAHLRALAQTHLTEIEAEKIQEQTQQSQAEADIQRYAKLSSLDRKQQAQASLDPSAETSTTSDMGVVTKKDRLRPFNEILHRIKWDPDLDIREYSVGFLERFEGIKEMPASNWIGDFSDEEWIPMHRVRYVKRVSSLNSHSDDTDADNGPALGIVWDRDARIDKISKLGNADHHAGEHQLDDVLSTDGTSVTGGMAL